MKEKSEGRDYSNLKAVSYKTQVVAGTNYFVKVEFNSLLYSFISVSIFKYINFKAKANDGKHVHLRIFKPLPCNGDVPELTSLQHDKSADDELNFF